MGLHLSSCVAMPPECALTYISDKCSLGITVHVSRSSLCPRPVRGEGGLQPSSPHGAVRVGWVGR